MKMPKYSLVLLVVASLLLVVFMLGCVGKSIQVVETNTQVGEKSRQDEQVRAYFTKIAAWEGKWDSDDTQHELNTNPSSASLKKVLGELIDIEPPDAKYTTELEVPLTCE